MKCFYHDDMDGRCAAAIVKLAHPECELLPINYGQEFPWHGLSPDGEFVYMVDFALQPFDLMERLSGLCELVWIDHHVSAIDAARERGFLCAGQMLEVGRAGCELAWEYFNGQKPVPRAVRLVGRYDVWDHAALPGTMEFQYGLRAYNMDPRTMMPMWTQLLDGGPVDEVIWEGRAILRYVDVDAAEYVRAHAFETRLDGARCIAMNRGHINSNFFKTAFDPERHDAMLSFVWRDGQWTVSLYTDKAGVDVSVIAKAYGGGGHKKAAGFQCRELPFALV